MIAFLDLGIRQAFAQDNLDPWHLPPHRGALNLAVGLWSLKTKRT